MPAPKGNLNSVKNGTRMVKRITTGAFPKPLRRVQKNAAAYRRALEQEVVEAKGEVNLVDAHHIDSATTFELHHLVCRWIIANKFDQIASLDLLKCSQQMASARAERNKQVSMLKLGRQVESEVAGMFEAKDYTKLK